MEKATLERLHSLLKQHEQLLEEEKRVHPQELLVAEREVVKILDLLLREEQARHGVDRSARLKAAMEAAPGLDAEITSLELLDDSALWNAAQTRMPPADSKRMEALHRKQRLTGLSEAENQELTRLEQQSERVILVRSHSTWLLEQRGHDIRRLISGPESRRPVTGRLRSLIPGG